ncbi:hypothetical protein [Salinifilum ghardaiensis]
MSRIDRHHRYDDLTFVAHVLARHHGRQAVAVPDIDAWLGENKHRRTRALLVVWDRTDAAILARERDDVAVLAAAPRLDWARRWAAAVDDIPDQDSRSDG